MVQKNIMVDKGKKSIPLEYNCFFLEISQTIYFTFFSLFFFLGFEVEMLVTFQFRDKHLVTKCLPINPVPPTISILFFNYFLKFFRLNRCLF